MRISEAALQSEVLKQTSKQAWDLARERDRYVHALVFTCLPLWPFLHSFFRSVYASLSLSRARSLRALQKTSVRLLALKGQGAVVPHVGHPSTDTCASCRDTGDPLRESLVNTVTTRQDGVGYEGDVGPEGGDGDKPGLDVCGEEESERGSAGVHGSETVLLRTATRSSSIGFAESSSSVLSTPETSELGAEGRGGVGMSEERGGAGQGKGGDAGISGRRGGQESSLEGGATEKGGGRQRMKEREKERERHKILDQELRVRPSSALSVGADGGGGKVRRGASVRVVRPESLTFDKLGVKPQVLRACLRTQWQLTQVCTT